MISSAETDNSPISQGWAWVKECNEALNSKNYADVRIKLAAYFKLGLNGPNKLHSAILSIAVKLGIVFPDFHLVPFLNIWGLENLRPEDSDAHTDESGRRIPSLVERLAKAYAYALLFHPEEHIEPELEQQFFPLLKKKGFVGENHLEVCPLMATRLIQKEVRGRKMTFVSLISSNGYDFLTEVHTLTTYQHLSYEDIPGTVFDTLLRTAEKNPVRDGNTVTSHIRIEAAILTKRNIEDIFPSKVGYVEFIDQVHNYTHIYDNESLHLVAEKTHIRAKAGDYVSFTPIIPKESKFKMAIIRRVLSPDEGQNAFGWRKAIITYTDLTKGYAAWKMLPEEDGSIHPIIEKGTTEPSFTKGYIHQFTATNIGKPLPSTGTEISIICFLKRGKDKQKRPFVVFFKVGSIN